MYETYQALTKPSNSRQPLWRYFPYLRLRDLLISEQLFFCHLPKFDDGKEGCLTDRSRQHLYKWFVAHGSAPDVAWAEVSQYEATNSQFYVNCWHMNPSESYLMWKAYADRGFAIQTTFERLQASFDQFEGVITGGVVEYVDFERDITALGNILNHSVTKDLPYKDEREFRLLFWRLDPRNANIEVAPNGVSVPVDLRMLIDRIYVNPFDPTIPAELGELLHDRGIECISSLIDHRQR